MRYRGFGPHEAYCAIHDPGAVQARRDTCAATRAAIKARARERYKVEAAARSCFATLRSIAEGHPDPVGLAIATLAAVKEADVKEPNVDNYPLVDWTHPDDYDPEGAEWHEATVVGSPYRQQVDLAKADHHRWRYRFRVSPWVAGKPPAELKP